MKMNTWMSLNRVLTLSALLALVACQEKVAPALTSAASAAGGGSSAPATTTGKLTLTLGDAPGIGGGTPAQLNYQLHKANQVAGTACEVNDISSTTPDTLPSALDVTCVLEAEELNLYRKGFSLNISNTADTCEYVDYTPFYFQQFKPGISARADGTPRVMLAFDCEDAVTTYRSGDTIPTGAGSPLLANGSSETTVGSMCGKVYNIVAPGTTYGSLSIAAGTTGTPYVEDQQFCSFDYSYNATANANGQLPPNCDEGVVNFVVVHLAGVTNAAGTVTGFTMTQTSKAPHNCDGNIRSCAGGPMPNEMGADWIKTGSTGRIVSTLDLATTNNYVVKSAYDLKYYTNRYSANFMRQCSGIGNFGTDASFSASQNSFNSYIIGDYASKGIVFTGSQVKDSNGWDIIPLGDDPFLAGIDQTAAQAAGLNSPFYWSPYRQSYPYYEFRCLDNAYDVKARIRLFVREWDRMFNINVQSFAYISDVFRNPSGTAYQDSRTSQTLPNGQSRKWNDILDWDDTLTFDDSGGSASCSTSSVISTSPFPGLAL